MNFSTPSTHWIPWAIRGATLAVIVFVPHVDLEWLALLLIVLGIPHGAADHLIFRSRLSHPEAFSEWRFVLFYLGIMAAYLLVWYVSPALALLIFVTASLFHFGQTYRSGLLDQLLWGGFALGFPVLVHFGEAQPILESMLGGAVELPVWATQRVPAGLLLLNVGRALQRRDLFRLLDLALLTTLYLSTPLLLGFAVYFLLWHSLPAARDQWTYLRQRQLTGELYDYLVQLTPYTLGALLFVGAVYYWWPDHGDPARLLGMLFILVSLITLPHAFLVDRVYRPPGA